MTPVFVEVCIFSLFGLGMVSLCFHLWERRADAEARMEATDRDLAALRRLLGTARRFDLGSEHDVRQWRIEWHEHVRTGSGHWRLQLWSPDGDVDAMHGTAADALDVAGEPVMAAALRTTPTNEDPR
jgi:hypothetical protein